MAADETKNIIRSLLISTPLKCTIKQLSADFLDTVGHNIPIRKLGFTNIEEYFRSIPDTVQIFGTGPTAELKVVVTEKSAHINNLVAKQKKNNIPAHKRKNLKVYYPNTHESPKPNRETPQRFNKNLVFEVNHKPRVPKLIQNKLRKLIMQFPDGIWCTQLKTEYNKMFKEDLSFEKYRYRSLIELCTDLPDIFHYIKPTSDDFMLYDKSRPIPSVNQNEIKTEDEDNHNFVKLSPINWSLGSSLIPPDVVYLSDEIPRFSFNNLKQGDFLDVCIGEIYDLTNFYMFLQFGKLNSILEGLELFFSSQHNRYAIPELFLEVGLYCTVYYKKKYHRCVIVDSLPKISSFIQVLFIDCGSVGRVHIKDVRYLPKEFGKIPCQAIKARLSRIRAVEKTDTSTEKFTSLVTNSELAAEVIAINEKDMELEIYLANITDDNNIFYINDILVEKGYAEYF